MPTSERSVFPRICFNVYGKTYDWLSNHLRLSKSKIIELLSAYRAMNEFLNSHPAPDNVRKFSWFRG